MFFLLTKNVDFFKWKKKFQIGKHVYKVLYLPSKTIKFINNLN